MWKHSDSVWIALRCPTKCALQIMSYITYHADQYGKCIPIIMIGNQLTVPTSARAFIDPITFLR